MMPRLCKRLAPVAWGMAALLVAVSCGGEAASTAGGDGRSGASTGRTNLLVVTIDTLRSSALGSYGSLGGHTPHLDALAQEGVVFEQSQAPMATTFPSHSSMFTGLYPRTHGVRWNGHTLDDDWTTLAESLSGAGYSTGAFVSYQSMVDRGGLAQGFDEVSDPAPKEWAGTRPGDETIALAGDWLDSQGDQPFMLWVHLFEPHSPYPVTEYAAEIMGDYSGTFADGLSPGEFSELPKGWHKDPREVEVLQALYHGRVRDADRLVGELLGLLDERGTRDQTLVAILGDHGQLLGEYGKSGHGAVLHQEVLETPFLIDEPGPRSGPARVQQMVGVIDLMPTVLELLEVPAPEGMHGRSLVPALRGQPLAQRHYVAEVRQKSTGPDDENLRRVAVFLGPYKLVTSTSGNRLYDMRRDAVDAEPLKKDDHPEVFEQLTAIAEAHMELLPGLGPGSNDAPLDAEALAELKALGYLK